MNLDRFRGVFVASVTPVTAERDVDCEAMKRIVDYYVESGLKGAFINSSSGEHFAMTQEQRNRNMAAAVEASAGRLTILGNVSDDSMARVKEQMTDMAAAGADAVVCMPPRFNVHDETELFAYFTELADYAPVPLILYNHMTRLNNKMSVDLVLKLSEHPNIIGVKDTHNDAARLMTLLSRLKGRDDFIVWAGGDGMAGFSALMGGYMLNALSAVRPKLMLDLQEAGMRGDVQRVMELQQEVNGLMKLFKILNPSSGSITMLFQSVKGALSNLGLCGTETIQMGYQLGAEDLKKIKDFLG